MVLVRGEPNEPPKVPEGDYWELEDGSIVIVPAPEAEMEIDDVGTE